MYRALVSIVLLGWFHGVGMSNARAAESAALAKEYAPRAEIVLRGTIELLGSATVTVDDAARLAVVRVIEVLSGPQLVRQFVGRDVTIHLRDPAQAKEGEEKIFFASVWHVGDGLGLVEVGSVGVAVAGVNSKELAMELDKARASEADAALAARIKDAQTIVFGKVVAIRPPKKRMLTEHDPEWSEADIDVVETLKGTSSGKMTILFPASQDVMWYRVPKPKISQSGIWLLKSGLSGAVSVEQAGVSDAGDFLPSSELPRVKKLLGR
jgi:hypothetical protein